MKYFNHDQSELCIDPQVIILHDMFSKYSEIPQTPENVQKRRDTKKEILDMA